MHGLTELTKKVTELPRGGYLVQTKAGYLQFGSPPETIKDTMLLPQSTPQIFILPRKLFNAIKGISLAELEFPIYYNFFIKKQKTHIICTEEQGERLLRVLREAVFGPEKVNLAEDVHSETSVVHDLHKELDFYKTFNFENLLAFHYFKNNECKINGVTIRIDNNANFIVTEDDNDAPQKSQITIPGIEIPGTIEYTPKFDIGERLIEPYQPPLFGVTCLGPSHGFDPTENTSGFIIWLNHRGIMIDPPVNSTEWLKDSNVNPKLIDSIILTHCHADHDAGTFQKIMEESRVTIYTTKTIIESFFRKYSALSNESIPYLKRLFDFNQVFLDKPFFIHGAEFRAFYSLHSIPTIGFKMHFQGQSFVYSSDHQGNPEIHDELLSKKIITQQRYDQLKNFPWESAVIFHEAGIPPLHTSINWLNTLPKDIKKKTLVYHIAKKDFPQTTSLTLAKFGMENTVYFKVSHPHFEKAYEMIGILKHLDFFQSFPIQKVQEFILAIKEEKYKKGEYIIHKDTKGKKFYIIYSGNVAISLVGLANKKIFCEFEYFGEVGLLTDRPTTADVIAETDVIVYTLEKNEFLSFIAGTEFEATLQKLIKNRDEESWNILSTGRFFKGLTSYQKTWLESVLERNERQGKGVVVKEGDHFNTMYIIRKGTIEVSRSKKVIATLKEGDFIGDLHYFEKNLPSQYTFSHPSPVSLYAIGREALKIFTEKNPGLVMKLTHDF
jgi:CRP-like cAMP-binding protein